MIEFRKRTAISAVALLLLTGCSTTTGGAGGADPAKRDLTAAGTYPIESLDPHGAQGAATGTQLAAQAIFSRLVRPGADGKVTGDLAEKWEPGATAAEWTFHLRAGATFSDGKPVTAADVVASFDRMMKLDGPNAGNFPGYKMTAPTGDEVMLAAPAPDASIPRKLGLFYVVPAGVKAEDTAFFEHPVGSGPFTVDRFAPSEVLAMAPNKKYWGGAPQLDHLQIRNIPDLSARLTALRTGEVDVVWGIPDDQLPVLRGEAGVTVKTVPSTAVFTMWFNSSTPALKTPRVRRALWQAVDFSTIIKQLYPETGALSEALVAPPVLGYAKQKPVGYDPQAAKAALQAADFDFGGKLRLQFSDAEFRPFVQAVASGLAEIGVKVDVLEKEKAVFTKDLLALNWDINFQQLATPTYDAASNLGRLYPCAAGRTGYCNAELDKLLAKAGASADEAERAELYGQAGEIIWQDAVGMYPMTVNLAYAWNKRIDAFTPEPSGLPDFSGVRLVGA
ncbi:peptide/nickel transport system substrate-binding protein [Streptosporangium album]|uniref:Peptide/nickel transport system substrate-binding protein n=1 Tax=Streptosporangium album TaxID=47479 RepID=A0A7W7S5P4_9ACTN|nr:ABC transporter substrate-binding protein [Streptosporangium album]MBB4944374.1 peptide/nickel transport system substrate-binding protein [Streptosporangium album]